jgi:rhodanese-related sulfurtransferase
LSRRLPLRTVEHREVLSAIAAGSQVVDVLPASEYRSAHIKGAIHLPLPKLIHQAQHTLDPKRAVVVYCRDCL